jgi:hypothetical protein
MSDVLPPASPRGQEGNPGFTDAGHRIEGLAYVALVTGVVSLVFNLFLLGPPALLLGPAAAIMGYVSRRRVTNSQGTLGGGGIALAGLVLGVIGFAVNIAWLFLIVVVLGPAIRDRSSR